MTILAGAKVDAADFTPGIGVGAPAWVFKGTAETVTNSVTMQDDDALFFTLAPGARYEVEFMLSFSGPAAADFKTGWTGPADINGIKWCVGPAIATTAGWVGRDDTNGRFSTHGITTVVSYSADTSGSLAWERGWVESATGGTLRLQWAQNTANATGIVVSSVSFLKYTRVS